MSPAESARVLQENQQAVKAPVRMKVVCSACGHRWKVLRTTQETSCNYCDAVWEVPKLKRWQSLAWLE